MTESLKQISFRAFTRSLFVLDVDADRDTADEYLSTVWGEDDDDNTAGDWRTAYRRSDISDQTADSVLLNICCELDPRYLWGASLVMEIWYFCLCRWARHNDVTFIEKILPNMGLEFDHRHAYCLTGESSASNRHYVERYLVRNMEYIRDDWSSVLLRPEMWDGGFVLEVWLARAFASRARCSSARLLHQVVMDSLLSDNPYAIYAAVAAAPAEARSHFFSRLSSDDAAAVLQSYIRFAYRAL